MKKLLSGAVGVLGLGREAAEHAAWWLRYQVDGTAHEEAARPAPQAADS